MKKQHAIALFHQGKKEEALKVFTELLKTHSHDADIHCHLGLIKEQLGDVPEAVKHYRDALDINPDLISALANLGNHLKNCGLTSAALEMYERAMGLNCQNSVMISNYANVAISAGKHSKSYELYLQAIALMPENFNARSNFLISTLYTNTYSPQQIFEFHKDYSNACHEKVIEISPYRHSRIRVGYVSGDFKRHSVAYFIEGILHYHDRDQFEVFCYSDVAREDDISTRIKSSDLTWRKIFGLNDELTRQQILEDEIDILVDLGGHTGKRQQMYAKRCAPLQATYLGYAETTGLKNMDIRIVDEVTDSFDFPASEKIIKLKRCFLAFCPPALDSTVTDSPCLTNDYLTIGSFNNLSKVTGEVTRLWIRILKEIKNSKILLKSKCFKDKVLRQEFLTQFTQRGIAADRVELLGYEDSLSSHLDLYKRLDIALDTFPYNGTTTSCEALHMGVPLITLEGKSRHAARVSGSILQAVGLPSLIAKNKNHYVELVKNLAQDTAALNKLRHSIRPLLHGSPLCNSQDLTQHIEAVFKEELRLP
jgi:protein O-GlcNAc transferase